MASVGCLIEYVALRRERERQSERAQYGAGDAHAEQYELAAVTGNAKGLGLDVADALDGVNPRQISHLGMIAGIDDRRRPTTAVDIDGGAGVEDGENRRCGVDRCCAFALQDRPLRTGP